MFLDSFIVWEFFFKDPFEASTLDIAELYFPEMCDERVERAPGLTDLDFSFGWANFDNLGSPTGLSLAEDPQQQHNPIEQSRENDQEVTEVKNRSANNECNSNELTYLNTASAKVRKNQ